jgi:hypothetical protein
MNLNYENELLILGTVTADTKGGPMGFEDSEGTFWVKATGLTED